MQAERQLHGHVRGPLISRTASQPACCPGTAQPDAVRSAPCPPHACACHHALAHLPARPAPPPLQAEPFVVEALFPLFELLHHYWINQADRDSCLQELGRLLSPAVFGTAHDHGLPPEDGGLLSDTGGRGGKWREREGCCPSQVVGGWCACWDAAAWHAWGLVKGQGRSGAGHSPQEHPAFVHWYCPTVHWFEPSPRASRCCTYPAPPRPSPCLPCLQWRC